MDHDIEKLDLNDIGEIKEKIKTLYDNMEISNNIDIIYELSKI
jgi:hypothetical protein